MKPHEESHATEPEVISASSLELIQRAEIDMQIATAKRYPRDLAKVKKRMIDFATLDEETAEACFYTLPRDGKTIQGPSVRLAEIAVACYGNLRAASRVISNDGKILTSQAACHDLENNTLISVEVQRRITNKRGETFSQDMQVTAGNAANAISFRNAVFKVIPGALVRPVYEMAKQVAVGNASTLKVRREKVISRLNAMHVPTPKILAKLGKSSVENIGLEDLEVLIGLGTAIKDGDTTVDEAFAVSASAEREERIEKQMAEQAAEAEREAGSQDARQAPQQDPAGSDDPQPKPEAPAPGSPWKTREEMMAAFDSERQRIGDDAFFAICGRNGLGTEDDMRLSNPATVAAHNELLEEGKPKVATMPGPEQTRPRRLVFGGDKPAAEPKNRR